MILFERSRDFALIRSVMVHPRLYRFLGDDSAPAPEAFRINEDPRLWYVLAYDAGELLGLFVLAEQSRVCWEIHCCLLPSAWGERARQASSQVFEWIFAGTSCRRIIAAIPEYNRLTIALARRAGMREFGLNAASFERRGKLHSLVLMGVSPKD